MVKGDGITFVATGITDNSLLRGMTMRGNTAITNSVVMRASSRTVRYVEAFHNLRHKTIRLHEVGETRL